jgi:hypothetical protein
MARVMRRGQVSERDDEQERRGDAAHDALFSWTMHIGSPEGYSTIIDLRDHDNLDELADRVATLVEESAEQSDVIAPPYELDSEEQS